MRDLISKVLTKDFLSLEDQTGNAREIEFVSYYRLTNFGQLLKAVEMIEQEQWELKLAKSEQNLAQGSIRVRREQSRDGQNVRFYETLKTVVPGSAGRDELTREIDESYFNAFKSTMSRGMLKLRCVIPIEGTEGTWPEDNARNTKARCVGKSMSSTPITTRICSLGLRSTWKCLTKAGCKSYPSSL